MTIERQSQVLKNEVLTDPLVRGYSGMNDQEVADSLNTVNRTRNKSNMTASEILNSVDETEFGTLTVAQEEQFWRLLSIGDLNPFGIEATIMTNLFGGGSTTIADLNNLRRDNISRAQELGFPRDVTANDVSTWRI